MDKIVPPSAEEKDAPGSTAGPSPPAFSPISEAPNPVFYNQHGLRAGWRFLLYVFMAAGFVYAFGFVLAPLERRLHPRLWMDLIDEASSAVGAILPAIVLGRFENRFLGDYGLPRRQAFGKLFWAGAFWGLASLSLLMLALRGVHAFYFGHLALHGFRILKFGSFYAALFLMVGFFEEFSCRGYSLFTLTEGMGFWPSAFLLSALFGGLHIGNRGESWVGAFAAGSIGLLFCFTVRRTGSLWFAVGMHASWDWGESFLYSVSDSGEMSPGHLLNSSFHGPVWLTGGSVGPEGSVLVFAVIALTWAVFDRVYRGTADGQVRTPAPAEVEEASYHE